MDVSAPASEQVLQLEQVPRIPSAEAVMQAARDAGRNPPVRDRWSGHDPQVRDAVTSILPGLPPA